MDYHSLKRRELQALCKEHNIPANSANAVLADKLSALLNEKQKSVTTRKRTCMKSLTETAEGEPAAPTRQAKKVRFSPRNDLREYEPQSGEKQKEIVTQIKSRRKSVAKKVDKPVVDTTTTVDLVDDSAQIPVKLTRSRVKDVEKGIVVDKETVGNVGKVTRSKAHALEVAGGVQREESRQSKRLTKDVGKASESVKEPVVSRARVTRSKAQTSMEGSTGHAVNLEVKKKSGKQVETGEQDVKPSVRATRSRRQSPKEDVENTVASPQADKKRTRREMKATDLDSDSSHVAPVGKQEPPKRKSLRSRGAETVDEDEGDKVEVVNVSRVTRSKIPSATETTRRNSRNSTKKVEVQKLEEPVNRPARMNTRRKSVIPKENKMVESPTVAKKQSKGQAKEDVIIRSGKVASENESKEVTSGSPKSRKRRGTPIIEDWIIKTEHGSLVDKSPKRSARSASRSEGKPVVKKQVESSLKKAQLSGTKQSSTHNASSSTKRAQLSGTKRTDSEDHGANSSKEGTPVAKMGNLKLDEEVTPAIDKSARRFTRGAIGSERKEPSQSAFKEQPIAEVQFSSPKVTKFLDDSVVYTAPGRVTRSGIRDGGNVAGRFSEKVGKKKQASQSARKKQSLDVAQMASPKVTEGGSDPDVGTVGARSETKQPLDDAQMTSADVVEAGPNPDVGTVGVQSEIKQSLDDAHMASANVTEVCPDSDVGTIGVPSETKGPLDEVQLSSPEVTEQPIAEAQFSSPKAVKFRLDPVVNTAPGRITRGGIKHDGNAVGSLSENVGKKKQTSQTANKKQPLDDAQIASAIVEEAGPDPNEGTIGVQSEIKQPSVVVEMSSPEGAEVGPNPDVDTVGVLSGIKQLFDEVRMSSPEVAEVETNSDVDTIGVRSEFKQPLDKVQVSSPDVAEVGPNTDVGTVGVLSGIKQLFDEVQMPSPEVADVDTIGVRSQVEQPSDEVQMASPEVAEVGPVAGADTIGARSVIEQPDDDVQMSSPEVAEVQPDLDSDTDTVEIGSDIFRTVRGQSLGDLSASESVRLPRKDMESASLVFGEKASVEVMSDADAHIEKLTYETSATPCLSETLRSEKQQNSLEFQSSNDETPLGKNVSHINMMPVSVSDGSHVQNQNREVNESGIFSEAANLATSVLKSGRPDAKEKEIDMLESGSISKGLQTDVMIEEPLVSVGKVVVVEEGDNGDADNNCDSVSYNVGSYTIKGPNELETGSELSNVNKTVEVPVSDNWDVQDGVSEHEKLTGNDNQATDEEDVEGDDSEPAQNEFMPVVAEVLVRSCDQEPEQNLNVAVSDVVARADTLEGSALDINKDVVSNILCNTYDMDTEDDSENEQKLTEVDEGFHTKESGAISSDMSNEKTHEEAGKSTWDDHTLDDQEQAVATDDLDSDSGKFMEDGSHAGVNVLDSELVAREETSPILYTKGECPVDADSDLPSNKKDDRNKQDETRKAGGFVDWGDYDYGMDDFEEPVSSNRSAEVAGDGEKDDQNSNFQSSARPSFSIEESSGLAAGLASSARSLGKIFSNATGGKSKQDVDKLKEPANAANMTEEGFDWSDVSLRTTFATPGAPRASSIKDGQVHAVNLASQDSGVDSYPKSFSTTPATTQISHVKDVQEDATVFAYIHHYSSTKTFDKTPGVTQISRVNDGREGAVDNQNLYSGMKLMFATQDASRTSHVNDSRTNAVNFTFPYGGYNEDMVTSGTAAREFNQPWGNEQLAFGGETQDSAVHGHEMYGVQSFGDDHLKLLFGDENVGGSVDASRSATHSVFKGDQVNQIKQFEFLGEAAGTSHHDPSALKDNSICSHEFEKNEESLVKGSETDNHPAFDTGHV